MGSASQAWKLELDAQWAETMGSVRDAIIYIGVEALDRVKRKTPVDTGHARNNWVVSIGAPDTASQTTATGLPEGDSFAARNMQMLSGYPEGEFPAVYLQNNLPYALRLEHGYSRQAPAGMVAITVAELEMLIQGMEV